MIELSKLISFTPLSQLIQLLVGFVFIRDG